MNLKSNWMMVAVFALLFLETGQGFTMQPMGASISTLVSNPTSFNGKLIKLRAFVFTDRHFSILLEEEDSLNHRGVALYVPEEIVNEPAIDALMTQIFTHPRKGMRKQVSATFVGIFEYHPGEIPNRVLKLTDVSDVKSTWVHE